MEATKLADILAKHRKWLHGEPGGERADLSGADLSGAVLRSAVLRSADLRSAVLENVKTPPLDPAFVAELGRRAAGDDLQRQMWAGLLALHSGRYCWPEWRKLAPFLPEAVDWLLDVVLAPWPEAAAEARAMLRLPAKVAVVSGDAPALAAE